MWVMCFAKTAFKVKETNFVLTVYLDSITIYCTRISNRVREFESGSCVGLCTREANKEEWCRAMYQPHTDFLEYNHS